MAKEDNLLYEAEQRIKELERQLLEKDKEIKAARKARFDDLQPQIIKDKVKAAKNLQRSKHMDDWSTDDLAAWFTELKMEEYIPSLYNDRVDGALFVNLDDEDIKDMGITNRFHLRKLELILRSYRQRYERRKEQKGAAHGDGVEEEEDDELLSEYAPSELSALIAAEDARGDDYSAAEDSEESVSIASEEDEVTKLTEEQHLQKRLDEQNIIMQLVMQGDKENFPIIGDIVRVKYVCILASTGKVVMSTKHVLERPWVEFVLGVDQVVKGFDRAIPLMSVGERSKITVTSEYAYGEKGLHPHIPPNATLTFDVTLLGFRPRTQWVKPLIQDVNTKEKPFLNDLKVSLKMALESGIIANLGQVFSASMILNDDEVIKLEVSKQKTIE